VKGGGKYIRVWVYDANAAYLNSVDNQGRVVNEALAAYSQAQVGNSITPAMAATSLSSTSPTSTVRAMSLSTSSLPATPPKLVCDNGHLMNAMTNKCVGKMCEFAK
jgi:hypothetical protein